MKHLQRGHVGPDEDFGLIDWLIYVVAVVGAGWLLHWVLQ